MKRSHDSAAVNSDMIRRPIQRWAPLFLMPVVAAFLIGFVWPFGKQNCEKVYERLKNEDFYGIRRAGDNYDETDFTIAADRTDWGFNAIHSNILSVSERFAAYPDDGTLKTFIFGVHSIDYERDGKWCDLEKFAREYGNRPEEYWYATNVEIFDYEDALNALVITEEKIENPSDITLYITVDGERIKLEPHSTYNF